MLKFLREQLDRLRTARAGILAEADQAIGAASSENRSLTGDEQVKFDGVMKRLADHDAEIEAAEKRLAVAEAAEQRSGRIAQLVGAGAPAGPGAGPSGVEVLSEPMQYGEGARHSYFLDFVRDQMGRGDGDGGVDAARDRLQRHAKELQVEMPRREVRRAQAAQQELRGVPGLMPRQYGSVFEKRTNPSRTDGQGGYFVPPLWLIDEYIDLPRFGRTIANSVRNMTLPGGTDSVNLPKISTGTATGVQTADAGAVTSTDMTDTSVSAPVRTIAGQQDIAIQLLDQSPISFDEVVFADLLADYNQRLDLQVINGSGSSGQMTGILQTSGINAVTYTDASPTLPELWVPLLQATSQVAKNRKMPALAVFGTPSVWYWALSQLDTTNRPLIAPAQNAFNPAALQTGADTTEGYVGNWSFGLPHLNDGNIPSNLGAGTNETRIIVMRTSDAYLWEGSMRTRTLTEVLSGTLQVRLQVYNYAAFMANRRPEAISVISGTGLIPASGF